MQPGLRGRGQGASALAGVGDGCVGRRKRGARRHGHSSTCGPRARAACGSPGAQHSRMVCVWNVCRSLPAAEPRGVARCGAARPEPRACAGRDCSALPARVLRAPLAPPGATRRRGGPCAATHHSCRAARSAAAGSDGRRPRPGPHTKSAVACPSWAQPPRSGSLMPSVSNHMLRPRCLADAESGGGGAPGAGGRNKPPADGAACAGVGRESV